MRKVLIFVCRKEDNAAQKHLSTKLEIKSKQILNPRYAMKHIFAHSRLFVLRLDKEWLPLHSFIVNH